ncbi:GumC family protein [Tritonibacter mobilis]|uniref:GumC family protein n=1 Tax=Tritonibacter mobilis TaxID=379347 RepID=UPI000E0D73E5|nr:polysaccharide biosynthesis tyrosine autokinase [Tritonibacter mobilis]
MKETKVGTEALRVANSRHEVEDDEIDLMELFRALWRGKWTIALAAILAVILGGYYTFGVADPQYRSSAQLTLEMRTKQVVDIESVVSGVSTEQAALNTEIEIILSRRVLGSLVDELNLTKDPEFNSALNKPSLLGRAKSAISGLVSKGETGQSTVTPKSPRDRTIAAVRLALSASVQRDTYVFTISATTGNPEKSALIVNTLSDIYIDEQIAVKFEATEQAVAWLSTRVTELEEELRSKEDTLKTATAETDLISPEALDGLNLQAKDLRDRLQEMRSDVERIRSDVVRLEEVQSSGNQAEAVNVTSDPTLRRLLRSIQDGDLEASDLFDERLATLVGRAQAEKDRLNSQISALSDSYQSLQERIERQSADLARIQQMQREVETTRTLYETFLTRLKETSVQRGLQQADSRILSDAIPGEQIAPRPALILALSIVLGMMIGAGFVLARTFLHNVFRTAEDLEDTVGIPVLGQIPQIPIKSRENLIGYLEDKPTSAASEAIRNLRTSILLSDIDEPPKVIMSTSSIPGEGKTTGAIALSQNLAGLGKKVLLIEGDIRRRTFSAYFDTQPKGGVITALSGETPLHEVVLHDERLGADILMGEKSRVNAADLFSSDRFREFMAKARDAYDFVIIDTPPVLVVPDARVIGQHVDAILFSVAWDSTHRSQVIAALREFDAVNLRVNGMVLAQIDPKGMRRYGYGGKYGAYASYGQGYYEAG